MIIIVTNENVPGGHYDDCTTTNGAKQHRPNSNISPIPMTVPPPTGAKQHGPNSNISPIQAQSFQEKFLIRGKFSVASISLQN